MVSRKTDKILESLGLPTNSENAGRSANQTHCGEHALAQVKSSTFSHQSPVIQLRPSDLIAYIDSKSQVLEARYRTCQALGSVEEMTRIQSSLKTLASISAEIGKLRKERQYFSMVEDFDSCNSLKQLEQELRAEAVSAVKRALGVDVHAETAARVRHQHTGPTAHYQESQSTVTRTSRPSHQSGSLPGQTDLLDSDLEPSAHPTNLHSDESVVQSNARETEKSSSGGRQSTRHPLCERHGATLLSHASPPERSDEAVSSSTTDTSSSKNSSEARTHRLGTQPGSAEVDVPHVRDESPKETGESDRAGQNTDAAPKVPPHLRRYQREVWDKRHYSAVLAMQQDVGSHLDVFAIL